MSIKKHEVQSSQHKNKLPTQIKDQLAAHILDDLENFICDVNNLEPKERIKVKLDIIKLLVPRPIHETEENKNTAKTAFYELFNNLNTVKNDE